MFHYIKEVDLGQVTMKGKVRLVDPAKKKQHENLLGFATITLTTNLGTLTISGWRIWKSKYEEFQGLNVSVPLAGPYKQVFASKPLMTAIKKMLEEAYEDVSIPIIGT